jgi:S1-C subfamily serine protease
MSAVGLGDTRGVLLAAVPDGSPAARFGLQENDVIRGVNGAPIRGLADFARRSQANTAPKRLVLELWRNQEKVSVAIPRD